MRVLVIDDEPETRHVIRRMLESDGHEVVEADDGAAGIRAFLQQPADVVVVDLLMPGKDGLETLQELRRLGNTVPCIAMSGGVGGVSFLPVAQKLGAAELLYKPFSQSELLEALERIAPTPAGA
jgi:DNA-binding response OmpR family regulator